ncbi:hypothetical protein VTN49DRAFT_7274 [Thermomyces lanuginosus]|uniref:uncharacterized protein n=1 Tax=Thermomyces lanuginosus TaxID=5541 RepID=UPI0037429E5C
MMSSRGSSTPHSVEQIARLAQDYEYNPNIPLRYWLRTAVSLAREAQIYETEGHDEQAYLLLFRHAQLILVHLVNHSEAKDAANRKGLLAAERQAKISIEKLEALKPRINKRYERYMQLMKERESKKRTESRDDSRSSRPHPLDPALAGVAKPLEARENKDLAVRLARREINRRAIARAGLSQEEENARRAGGLWGDWEQALQRDEAADGDHDDISRRIQQIRMNLDRPSSETTTHTRTDSSSSNGTPAFQYPSVPRQSPFDANRPTISPLRPPTADLQKPPAPPPKDRDQLRPPPRPQKIRSSAPPPLPSKEVAKTASDPFNTDLDPSTFTFKPAAYLENGTPLRTVFLPPNLRKHFLAIAEPNTRRNLETCGILCGTLISNALFISKLLIPEQESTPDTCETVNESAIFDYCDSEDLMMLGWIHTHPTQSCFMSSRDLHTHCGYQVMLPESIAIVCAPSKDPDWGVFRLTDPPGLKAVLNCTQTGLFHPHSETNLYTDALRPGHVFEAHGLEFETVDLRPRK